MSSYAIMAVQLLLHGFNFALYWATAVEAIKRLAPARLNTSSLATLNMCFFILAGKSW
jgi:predicted MFS family arabinose efflux permease